MSLSWQAIFLEDNLAVNNSEIASRRLSVIKTKIRIVTTENSRRALGLFERKGTVKFMKKKRKRCRHSSLMNFGPLNVGVLTDECLPLKDVRRLRVICEYPRRWKSSRTNV